MFRYIFHAFICSLYIILQTKELIMNQANVKVSFYPEKSEAAFATGISPKACFSSIAVTSSFDSSTKGMIEADYALNLLVSVRHLRQLCLQECLREGDLRLFLLCLGDVQVGDVASPARFRAFMVRTFSPHSAVPPNE